MDLSDHVRSYLYKLKDISRLRKRGTRRGRAGLKTIENDRMNLRSSSSPSPPSHCTPPLPSRSSETVEQVCPVCNVTRIGLIAHLRNVHGNVQFTDEMLAHLGLVACECGSPFVNVAGRNRHLKHSRGLHDEKMAQLRTANGNVPGAASQSTAGLTLNPSASSFIPAADVPRQPLPLPQPLPNIMDRHKILFDLPGVDAPLSPYVATLFRETVERLCTEYNREPSEENLFNIFSVVKVGLAPENNGHRIRRLQNRLSQFPNVIWPEPEDRSRELPTSVQSLSRRVGQQIEKGNITRASRILDEDVSQAPRTAETVEKLRELHPSGPNRPFDIVNGPVPHCGISLEYQQLETALKTFAADTAAGISGWTLSLIHDVFLPDSQFSKFIIRLSRQIAQGSAPGRQFVCASRLLANLKKSGGIRPLPVPEMFYRWPAKGLLAKGFAPGSLLPCQFGVGSSGGVEPILRLVEKAIDQNLPIPYDELVEVDLKNAFNEIDRKCMAEQIKHDAPQLYKAAKWVYNEPTPLYYRGPNGALVVIMSEQGGRQGDPLFVYFFSLAYKPVLQDLSRTLGDHILPSAYLEDSPLLTVGNRMNDVKTVYARHRHRGIIISEEKTRNHRILEPSFQVQLLGGYLGPYPEAFLETLVQEEIQKLLKLDSLTPQHSLLLLRFSIQQRLRHLMRTLPPTPQVLAQFELWDKALLRAVLRLRNPSVETQQPLDQAIVQQPVRFGGLGFLSHRDVAPHARAAMIETSDFAIAQFQSALLDDHDDPPVPTFQSQRQRCLPMLMEKQAQLTRQLNPVQLAFFIDNQSFLASQWLSAIPYNLFHRLSGKEINVGLSYRTLIPGHLPVCLYCDAPNELGHDETGGRRVNMFTVRHESLKNTLAHHLRTIAGTEVITERFIDLRRQQEGAEHDLRTDLTISGPASFQHASTDYDLTLLTAGGRNYTRLPASRPAANSDSRQASATLAINQLLDARVALKNRKYAGRTGKPFYPIVLTSGGTLSTQTKDIFDFWRSILPGSTYRSMSINISIGLLRSRARPFVL